MTDKSDETLKYDEYELALTTDLDDHTPDRPKGMPLHA